MVEKTRIIGLFVEELGQRLVEIQQLSSEQPVKDALGALILDVFRAGDYPPIVEPPISSPADA